jgi:signal transduction histidine kinase/AmiR/NasT family two-component response regulator
MFEPIYARVRVLSTDVGALARGRHPESPSDYGLTAEHADSLMKEIYLRGDRLMGWFLLVHAVIAFGLAFPYQTWFVSVVVSLSALGLFFVNARLCPGSFGTRVAAGVALQTFVALHIYQLHGLAEMHFWFFTAFTMMIVYQDWLCMWPGALLIIGQHILFALLHNSGVPLFFFEVDSVTVFRLFFHFGIAVVQVGICGYWAVLLRRETFTDAGQRERLRLQSEELARARDEAFAASRAKGDFLAMMSHEIRTPMNGVIGTTGLLRDTRLSQEQQEYVGLIHDSGESLLRIINDILDFSKIEAGRFQLDINDFEVRPLAHGTLELISEAAARKGLRIRCDVAPDVPLNATGDSGRIRQVLVNFLGNAVKYTDKGEITLSVSAEHLQDSTVAMRFEVRDTGIGISPEGQVGLFESFSRVDAARTRGISGTGLGLAICQRLAATMGGNVGVSSQIDRGSTFWFVVPLRTAQRGADPAREPAALLTARHDRPWRILVADDNTINQTVARKILEKLGCRVDVVPNGAEAVRAIERLPYDMVLMDCQMPVMDGYEASMSIRRLGSRGRRVPIVALTAAAIEGDRERCLAAGMDDYIAKPARPAQLAEVLGRWLTRPAEEIATDQEAALTH